jgi:hypothetical protein
MRPLKPTDIRPNRDSSRVVADLTQHRDNCCDGAGVAYFYCDFTRSEFQCAKNAIGSLVAQLCSQFPYPEELLLSYKDSLLQARDVVRAGIS